MRIAVMLILGLLGINVFADAPIEVLSEDDSFIVEPSPDFSDNKYDKIAQQVQQISDRVKKLEKTQVNITKLQLDLAKLAASIQHPKQPIKPKEPQIDIVDENVAVYHKGLSSLQAKNYPRAQEFFKQYIAAGSGKYINDAYYHLGEIAFFAEDFEISSKYFLWLLEHDNNKYIANVYLKLAIINEKQDMRDKARNYLVKLLKNYPDTSEAHIAKIKLKRHY